MKGEAALQARRKKLKRIMTGVAIQKSASLPPRIRNADS
jgi:hypothetical protein